MISKTHRKPILVKFLTWAIATQITTIGFLMGCGEKGEIIQKSTSKSLVGTWAFKKQEVGKASSVIFELKNTVDGNFEGDVYLVTNNLSASKTAIAGIFKANSSSSPKQLDLVIGDLTTKTIYEISDDGELKIANTVPDQVRPTVLDSQSQILTKISDSKIIPNDIKILRSLDLVSGSVLIRQTESKSYIRAIMRSQQQIFQERGQFASDIKELMLGVQLNSELYSYKIAISSDTMSGKQVQIVQNNAIPLQDGLKAYTGIIFAFASDDSSQKTIKTMVCESNNPTKELPLGPKKQDEIYLCPDSYTAISP